MRWWARTAQSGCTGARWLAFSLNNVILALSAFQGLFNEIMPHGHAWRLSIWDAGSNGAYTWRV
jgi:hypothetical protein